MKNYLAIICKLIKKQHNKFYEKSETNANKSCKSVIDVVCYYSHTSVLLSAFTSASKFFFI